MPKLALVALAFVAFLAFTINVVSAFRTTEQQYYCRREIPIEELNYCQKHLTQGIIFDDEQLKMVVENSRPPQQQQQKLQQQCCGQLKKVEQQCQCTAIQQAYDEARQQGGVVEMRQMLYKAQRLPEDCGLEVQGCPIASPRAN